MQAADTEGTQPQCRGVDMGLGGMPLGVACKGGELTGKKEEDPTGAAARGETRECAACPGGLHLKELEEAVT